MIQTLVKSLTIDEFLKLPETKPACELIDGVVITKPSPQGKHSTIQLDLGSSINLALKPQRIARAYSELRCNIGDRSLIPDISVFVWERSPRDRDGKVSNKFDIAPDWVVEILPPDQNQTKVIRNILYCLDHGSEMGWLIVPDDEIVFVYFRDRTIAVFENKSDILPVPSFAKDFQITLGDLFSWLEV